MKADLYLVSDYLLLPPLLRLLPPLLRLLPDDEEEEPDDREGGATDPLELLPDDRGAVLLGRGAGREGAALGRVGREELDGRAAGRVLVPVGRVDEGLALLAGCLEVPGRMTAPLGLREVFPDRIVPLGRVAVFPRVADVPALRVPVALPRVAIARVEIRPFASRLMAVREAVRVVVPAERLERPVRTSMRDREAVRTPRVRLSMITVPG